MTKTKNDTIFSFQKLLFDVFIQRVADQPRNNRWFPYRAHPSKFARIFSEKANKDGVVLDLLASVGPCSYAVEGMNFKNGILTVDCEAGNGFELEPMTVDTYIHSRPRDSYVNFFEREGSPLTICARGGQIEGIVEKAGGVRPMLWKDKTLRQFQRDVIDRLRLSYQVIDIINVGMNKRPQFANGFPDDTSQSDYVGVSFTVQSLEGMHGAVVDRVMKYAHRTQIPIEATYHSDKRFDALTDMVDFSFLLKPK